MVEHVLNDSLLGYDVDRNWQQPPENTLESLRHGILHSDGIELDLRKTADGQLIVHHDAKPSSVKWQENENKKYVEDITSEEMMALGFPTIQEVLADNEIRTELIDHGKFICLELKRPHPRSITGPGFFGGSVLVQTMAETISQLDSILSEFEIPLQSTVYYAFHNKMHQSVKLSKTQRQWAELLPVVPRIGNSFFKKMIAYPQYAFTPFSKLIRKHQTRGSSMVPCAIEYFKPITRSALFGKRVGLNGRKLDHFSKCQKGFPVYVWPCHEKYEKRILDAGITGLTDNLDPNLTWLPSGNARWARYSTKPLDEKQLQLLYYVNEENHLDVINQLNDETPSWHECDKTRKLELIKYWRKKWNWNYSVDELIEKSTITPPLQTPKIIGHRGSGKTSRPVL